MIRVAVRTTFKPEAIEQVLALYGELAEKTRQEAGCREYVIARDKEQPEVLAVLEAWQDEATLAAHMQSEHFTRLVPQIGAFDTGEKTIHVYTQVI